MRISSRIFQKRRPGGWPTLRWGWIYLGLGLLVAGLIVSCGGAVGESAPEADCRLVVHAQGETCVPLQPQRVVVLTSLDSVLALGVKPIATADPIDPYLGDRAEGIEFIGQSGAPNLERILALQPDLVLGINYPAHLYGSLSQIAPTVLAKFETSGEWKQVLATYAAALGREAEAAQVMAAYEARLQDFQTRMGDDLTTTEVSIVRVRPDAIDIYPEDSFCGTVVADAGLPRPATQAQMSWIGGLGRSAQQAGRISKERLDLADGDVMFVWTYGSHADLAQQAQTALERLQADPLWAKLNAVQQGRVYEVPDYWIGLGPLAAQAVIDDLFTYLLPES